MHGLTNLNIYRNRIELMGDGGTIMGKGTISISYFIPLLGTTMSH